jgi:AcrR family transcriptional regulator
MSGATASKGAADKRRRLTREEKREQTRERLLEAAERVFMRRGFQNSSVEEISAEAGYTRGAFYSNFSSKEELFIQLLHARVFDGYREILMRTPQDATPREQLHWGAEQAAAVQDSDDGNPTLFQLWFECLLQATRDEEFRKLAATFWSGNRALVAENFRRVYAERGLELPLDAKALSIGMTALDIGLAVQHLVDPEEVTLDLYPKLYELLFGDLVDPV